MPCNSLIRHHRRFSNSTLSPNTTTHPTVGATGSSNLSDSIPGTHSLFHWTDEWKVNHGSPTSYFGEESKNTVQ